MLKAGILRSRREGRGTRYSMSGLGRNYVQDGQDEYFAAAQRPFSGLWTMVVYRVPEAKRELRDGFRAFLEFSSFAQMAPSVWIRPDANRARLERELAELRSSGKAEGSVLHLRFEGDPRAIAARYWDIGNSIAGMGVFVRAWRRKTAATAGPASGKEAFRLLFTMDADWLVATASDPRLPAELLPADWPGFEARRILHAGRGLWEAGARRFAESTIARREEHGTPRRRGVRRPGFGSRAAGGR